jgi:hypothetical protein
MCHSYVFVCSTYYVMIKWQDNSQVQVRESLIYLIFSAIIGEGHPSMTCPNGLFKILYSSNNAYIYLPMDSAMEHSI